MNTLFIDTLIKNFGITITLCYIYFKLINFKKNDRTNKYCTILFSTMVSIAYTMLKPYFFNILLLILFLIICSIFLSFTTKSKLNISIFATIISASISYIVFMSCSFILLGAFMLLNIDEHNPFLFILIILFQFLISYYLFKIKRLKNGFPFLYNKHYSIYIDVLLFITSIIVILTYFLFGNFENISLNDLFLSFVCFIILIFFIIKKAFSLYHMQKLLYTTLKDYEHQLSETQQKLQTALAEKQTLIKSNHEFYHRQEALNKKIDDLANQFSSGSKTEFSEDYGNIVERINNLSEEYVSKTKTTPTLPKCGIVELDDMLNYMKSECDKNNIEFILNIDCDVNYMIDNYISKSQLETLLGDLIRNSIIAVNHSSNDCKSIMVVLGIKDESYELCILDNGIPFEIDTLLNLGLVPSSTHLNEGGSGIGFITTFETLKSCKASFVITELTNNTYTKSLEIKFDNKLQYVIISDRHDEIKSCNKSNRDIIIKEN